MSTKRQRSTAARLLGEAGGRSTSPAKLAACKRNAQRAGRPRLVPCSDCGGLGRLTATTADGFTESEPCDRCHSTGRVRAPRQVIP